jgi:hypothetical protein
MLNLLILAAAGAVPTAPAKAAATASTVIVTAPRRAPEWVGGEAAERYRLRDLPPEPRSGAKRLNPVLRLTF